MPRHCRIAYHSPRLSPASIQDLLHIAYPLSHAFHLLDLLCPVASFCHDDSQARQFLDTQQTYCPPFFSSRSRLAATSSRSSPVCTAAKSNGARPSRLSAVSIPAA